MITSYASYFVAFLLSKVTTKDIIIRIILFGSVARDEATTDSDVDLFIELKNKKVEKEIKKIEKEFYQSREAVLFKAQGIDNKINIKMGTLKNWKDLYTSIASTGIVLYGPYEAKELPSAVNHNLLVFWDHIGKNRGAFLNKLYGYAIKGKRYAGLLEKSNGTKTGKSSIMVSIHVKKELFTLLKDYEVKAKVIEVFS